MPVTDYCTIDGEVVSEIRNGTERDYVPDPLGGTVALLDGSQTKTDTYTYWPYGEIRTSTGTNATPFKFVGTLGYFRESSTRTYVRARTYQQGYGRWMTVDLLWPIESSYSYCRSAPNDAADPSGRQFRDSYRTGGERLSLPPGQDYVSNCCDALENGFWWFKGKVQNKGPWDFKQCNPMYQDAGNYHYGFMAACLGLSRKWAQFWAGVAQVRSGTSRPEWQNPIKGTKVVELHKYPYGDDPIDQAWIIQGYQEAEKWMAELKRKCRYRGARTYFPNIPGLQIRVPNPRRGL